MVERIGNYRSKWGEGPIWYQNRLYYVDIEGHHVCSFDPETGAEEQVNVGERVGLILPRSRGGFVIGGDNGLNFLDWNSGEKSFIADPEPDKKPANRFNDGKCDPAGRVWAGTISTIKKEGDASLYCLEKDLSLSTKVSGVTNSNGLCWTSDYKTFYYIDTPTKKILAFDFNAENAEISNKRVAIDTSSFEGSPDGMTIDENDCIWVAFCRGSCVRCINPKTGEVIKQINLPVSGVTSCVFGGENLDTLFITTGQFSGVEEENAGYIFKTSPGIKGTLTSEFKG